MLMYENYTRQSLPTKYYRELLGSAICVFNSNNAFIIENILRFDDSASYNWYELIDKTSGNLTNDVKKVISEKFGNDIEVLFDELVTTRNRIVHSYRITNSIGEQVLATKEKIKDGNRQFEITESFLLDFISKNEKLSDMLHGIRGY